MSADDILTTFLAELEQGRGLSDSTRRAYRDSITRWMLHLDADGLDDLDEAGRADVISWTRTMNNRELAPSSIYRHRSALKQFYQWLIRTGRIEGSPIANMRNVKVPDKLPKVLTKNQVQKLLDAPEDNPGRAERFTRVRDRAAMAFLYYTGARVSEAVGADVQDVSFQRGWVRLFGKGSKEREVPLADPLRAAIQKYFTWFPSGDEEPLFPSANGGRIGRRGLRRRVKQWARRAGLPRFVGPHTLRHSFATHMLQDGLGLRYIQQLLGHADLSTTQIYTHVANADLESQFHAHMGGGS